MTEKMTVKMLVKGKATGAVVGMGRRGLEWVAVVVVVLMVRAARVQ